MQCWRVASGSPFMSAMTGHNAAAVSYQDSQRDAATTASFRSAARCSSGLTNSAVLPWKESKKTTVATRAPVPVTTNSIETDSSARA